MSALRASRPDKDRSFARILRVTPRLPVTDLARTVGFYTEMLGFRAAPPWPADAPTFVVLEQDDMSLQFYTGEFAGAEPTGHGTIYFDVSDVRAMHRALSGHLPIEWGPEVYWYGRSGRLPADLLGADQRSADLRTGLRAGAEIA